MKFFDRVRVVCETTGQGTITLGAAVSPNFFTLEEAGAVDGDETFFVIEEAGNVEICTGVVGSSATTLTRATVHRSKIAGIAGTDKIELGGDAVVYLVDPALWLNEIDAEAGLFKYLTETIKTDSYTVLNGDAGTLLTANKATSMTFTLPAVAGASGAHFFRNIGAGDMVVDGSGAETIEGSATRTFKTGESAILYRNEGKTAWRAMDIGIGLRKDQNLNDLPSKSTARTNLEVLAFVAQTLTATQQAQARANISAALKGHIFGLTLSNNITDANNDIDIAAGEAASTESNPVLMVLAGTLTKRLDASWAVGSGNGGRDTGSIADGTWHVWLIQRSDTGVVDVLFSISEASPTMPTNYDRKRRIGSFTRASSVIVGFVQRGDMFTLKQSLLISQTNPGTAAVSRTLNGVPTGIIVDAIVNMRLDTGAGGGSTMVITPLDADDQAPGTSAPLGTVFAAASSVAIQNARMLTNNAAQVRTRNNFSDASVVVRIATVGWIDRRGKDGLA